jgi:hypothetical protein
MRLQDVAHLMWRRQPHSKRLLSSEEAELQFGRQGSFVLTPMMHESRGCADRTGHSSWVQLRF